MCPRCGRRVFPSKKKQSAVIRLTPDEAAIREFVAKHLRDAGFTVTEDPIGLFRVSGRAGEVHVAIVDFCREEAIFSETYSHRGRLVFVIGNDREYTSIVPDGVVSFRLAEMALGAGTKALVAHVRKLARLDVPEASVRPAVLKGRRPRASTRVDTRDAFLMEKFKGVTRMPMPRGTRWNQIEVYLADGDTIRVRAPGVQPASRTAAQIGMTHRGTRKATQTVKWKILEGLCEGHGACDWQALNFPSFNAFKVQVGEMNELLQFVFDIQDSYPLVDCSKEAGVRSAFQASPDITDNDQAIPRW